MCFQLDSLDILEKIKIYICCFVKTHLLFQAAVENKARIRMLYEPILVNRQLYGYFDGKGEEKGKWHKN